MFVLDAKYNVRKQIFPIKTAVEYHTTCVCQRSHQPRKVNTSMSVLVHPRADLCCLFHAISFIAMPTPPPLLTSSQHYVQCELPANMPRYALFFRAGGPLQQSRVSFHADRLRGRLGPLDPMVDIGAARHWGRVSVAPQRSTTRWGCDVEGLTWRSEDSRR